MLMLIRTPWLCLSLLPLVMNKISVITFSSMLLIVRCSFEFVVTAVTATATGTHLLWSWHHHHHLYRQWLLLYLYRLLLLLLLPQQNQNFTYVKTIWWRNGFVICAPHISGIVAQMMMTSKLKRFEVKSVLVHSVLVHHHHRPLLQW